MLQLRIFNTHSRKIENFAPLHPNKIKMYVCGVTPYDTSHLGHAFVFIFFDVVKNRIHRADAAKWIGAGLRKEIRSNSGDSIRDYLKL